MAKIMNKEKYIPRIIDTTVERYLTTMGAVCIEGPKWCGKACFTAEPGGLAGCGCGLCLYMSPGIPAARPACMSSAKEI